MHSPYPGNQEVSSRVSSTWDHFQKIKLLDEVEIITPEPASDEDILLAHSRDHIAYIKDISANGYSDDELVNTDAYIGGDTYAAALASAGSVIGAAEAVLSGQVKNCFSLNRPPGHHSSIGPCGFCYFNNLAVAIKRLQRQHGIGRVVVFDWDAHAGNGTMDLFYSDPSVLTISIHQDPYTFYPGKGFIEEMGTGAGLGFCINIPVPAGTGDTDYMYVMDELVVPKITEFKPEFIFVAAGQDSHKSDGISGLQLTDDGFATMTSKMVELAECACGGRLALSLEGGYNLGVLPKTHEAIVKALSGIQKPHEVKGRMLDSTKKIVDEIKLRLSSIACAQESP